MCETKPGDNYDKTKARRGYSSLKAVDPHDGAEWDLLLSDDKMDRVAREGKGATMELADTVKWSLLNPSALFRGVRDDEHDVDDDGWLCYVATPKHAYNRRTAEKVRPWKGEVFVVYVTDERVVYQWFWVDCDQNDSSLPVGYDERFRERVL